MTSTEANNLVWAKGRGRGFRPKGPFSPSRRPGENKKHVENQAVPHDDDRSDRNKSNTATQKDSSQDNQEINHLQISKDHKYIAKFNYKANIESPLGEAEVDLDQGEYVTVEEKHKDNPMWWKVKRKNGDIGFVPAKYVHKLDERITALPWLANKQIEIDDNKPLTGVKGQFRSPSTGVKVPLKAYVSAYKKEQVAEVKKKQYYCDVCEKQLNGPQPYSAHMVSKAHKLEVELAEERERDDQAS